MKKIILICLCVLLSISLFACKKDEDITEPPQSPVTDDDTTDENENPIDFDFLNELNEEVKAGTVSKDDYVACTLLSIFKGNDVPDAFREETLDIADIRPYVENAVTYWDELSEETQKSVLDVLTLNNIEFSDEDKSSTGFMSELADTLFDDVSALTDKVVIDQALLSKSGKFVVWYSDTDPNSADRTKAQLVADTLDEAVKAYDRFFNVSYKFVSEYTYDGSITYAKQGRILQRCGIDPTCLFSCMNVYLSDFSNNSVKAFCLSGFDEFGLIEKLIIPAAATIWGENGLYGVRAFPFIAIDSDSPIDTEMKQVIYHELFHYYQKRILRDEPYCCDIIGGESTANWAAALQAPNTDNKNGFGDWADLWATHCADWLAYAGDNAGYGLYPMLLNYQLSVENGKQKIVDALFETDFLKYLEDSTTLDERKKLIADLAKHTFANDNTKPVMNAKKPRINTTNLSAVTPVTNAVADALSIRYYQVNETAGDDTKLSFDTTNDTIMALLIAKLNDGSSSVIRKITKSNETVTLSAIDNLYHYFVAVCNASFTVGGTYSIRVGDYTTQQGEDILRFEKTVLVDNDEITITALGGSAEDNLMVINCEYQSKSSSTLYLKDDNCILNGYSLNAWIADVDYDGLEIEPNSTGKLTLKVLGTYPTRHEGKYKFIYIPIQDEYCCDQGFDLNPCFAIKHVKGEENENDYVVKGNTIKADGGAATLPDSIIELYTKLDTEQLSLRKLNQILLYQPMEMDFDGLKVLASAVAMYQDGSHIVMVEVENTTDSDIDWLDYLIGVDAVNGVAVDSIFCDGLTIKSHTKGLCYIDTYSFSSEKRKAMYGFESIGSYDIFVHHNHSISLDGYTLSFGEECPCAVGQLLYEDDYGCYYYVGAGPTMLDDTIYDEVLLVLKKDKKSDWLDHSNIKEVYADSELVEHIIIGENCIRNGAFYEIELDNIDPTVNHELKIVTRNNYGIVVDEIVIPYIGQPKEY